MLQIDALPAFNDNYIWLLQDTASKRCAVVDPGDAAPVEAWLAQHPDWTLSDILITNERIVFREALQTHPFRDILLGGEESG